MLESLVLPVLLALGAIAVWWWFRRGERQQAAEFLDTQGSDDARSRAGAEIPPAAPEGLGGTGPRRPRQSQ